MTINFFKEHLHEEVEGAKEFAMHANETRASHPQWSRKLMEVSQKKMQTAECLIKMLEEYNALDVKTREQGYNQGEYEQIYREVMDEYTQAEPQITSMKQMYNRR